jgi:uncharacterized protein (TIGR02118 family)
VSYNEGSENMYKLVSYWSSPKPEDVDAFEQYYHSAHVPRAAIVPNLERIILTRVTGGFEGGKSYHYRIAEMVFANEKAMAESSKSPEWAEMRNCARGMCERFGVTVETELGDEVIGKVGAPAKVSN